MRNFLLAAVVSGLALVATSAISAEVKYSSEDVVSHLLKSANLGATKGVCVGTAEQCSIIAKPAGFDVFVNFELNSAELTEDAKTNLKQVALALTDPRLQGARFAIEGYTDARGTDIYNLGLSDRRAASVAGFLVEHGVSTEKLAAIGLGKASPRMPDPFDPLNRRVELRLDLQ